MLSSTWVAAKFSRSRAGVIDFGMVETPRWRCHAINTWAGVQRRASAIDRITGSSSNTGASGAFKNAGRAPYRREATRWQRRAWVTTERLPG